MMELCLCRIDELLQEPFDPNIKVTTACMLLEYAFVAMDPAIIQSAIKLARPLLNAPQLSTPRASQYFQAEGYLHYLRGHYTQSLACFDAVDEITRESNNFDGPPMIAIYQRGFCERRAGLSSQAGETLRKIESRAVSMGFWWRDSGGHERGPYGSGERAVRDCHGNHKQVAPY
jgi:hypothetical protein